MKILAFNWQDIKNPLGGGAEVHFHEIFSRIAKLGHEVTLFCSSFPGAPERENIDCIEVIRKGGRNTFNFWVPLKYWMTFHSRRFDVVIDDINKIPFFTPVFAREPVVGIAHHLFGKTIFLETHFLAALYVYLSEKLIRYFYPRTPLLVVSESTREEFRRLGFPEESLSIAPNCIDPSIYRPTGVEKSKVPLVGYFGRLKKYKSVDHLLSAFRIVRKDFPEARLMIVGDGDDRARLERIAQENGLGDSVEFAGYVSVEKKIEYLQEMHFVVNSSSKEGWGLTVLEANACGTCVIASDVPGLRDAVVDGETGLLYEYGNVRQLADKISLLLHDQQLRKRLSDNALEWSKKFRWEDSARKTLEVLEKAVASATASLSSVRRGTKR
jgi:glycosyltransferase involved in cell wall biosynthesis